MSLTEQLDRAVAATIAVEDASAAWFEISARDGVGAAFMSPVLDEWVTALDEFRLAISELHQLQHAAGNGRH